MLRARTYPELLGKALVLEAEPFATMADDEDPWVEGLFFLVCLGVVVGLAQFVGGVLLTASMPPVESLREASMTLFRQVGVFAPAITTDVQAAEAVARQAWDWLAFVTGYGGGWSRLLMLILVPALSILAWLLYGSVSFVAARRLGGIGSFNQTLGVTALAFAPLVLLVLTAIPFVSVGGPLLWVWALLIGFRGLEVAHDLSWQRSVLAALAGPALLLLIGMGGAMILGLVVLIGGLA